MLTYLEIIDTKGTWTNPLDTTRGCHTLNEDEKKILKSGLAFIDNFSFHILNRLRKDPQYDISYNHELDRLQIPIPERFKTIEHYLISIFHEYGHATGHKSRLNRISLLHCLGINYNLNRLEEITAELVALKIGKKLKLNYDWMNCYCYINSHLKSRSKSEKIQILNEANYYANIAVKYLLNN